MRATRSPRRNMHAGLDACESARSVYGIPNACAQRLSDDGSGRNSESGAAHALSIAGWLACIVVVLPTNPWESTCARRRVPTDMNRAFVRADRNESFVGTRAAFCSVDDDDDVDARSSFACRPPRGCCCCCCRHGCRARSKRT